MQLLLGDSLDVLKTLPADSVDSVVTDPPYGLAFMGKKWDYDVPSVALWTEVLRVLKPGGHLLSFGGTRTYHRMVVAIEDAGFEIRDQIQWIYGSGFPKSMCVSKAIDKAAGAKRQPVLIDSRGSGSDRFGDDCLVRGSESKFGHGGVRDISTAATDAAKQWQGWGTALKPANEPIVLARKPLLEKTVAKNVLKYGTGALNIDASRIAGEKPLLRNISEGEGMFGLGSRSSAGTSTQGRWPANVLFDEDAASVLDEQSGLLTSGSRKAGVRKGLGYHGADGDGGPALHSSSGSASRFFYVAKASKRERNAGLEGMPVTTARSGMGGAMPIDDDGKERDRFSVTQANYHPTVKPIKLMEYLIRLITPPGGTVLEPFLGSGTTLVAAANLGFNGVGIEREPEYLEIAKRRIAHAKPAHEQSAADDFEYDTGA